MNKDWSRLTDPEFRKDMFEVAEKLRCMVMATSGAEEGLNVILTIMGSFANSMHDGNWQSMIRAVEEGLLGGEGPEAKMEQAVQLFFSGLNKLRKQVQLRKSKYISPCNKDTGEDENKEDASFPEFPGRGGLAT